MISTIAKAEVTGFEFNTVQWLEIYNENLKELFIVECKLDEEVRRLRKLVWKDTDTKILYMKGGKWDNIRKHNPVYDLFNDDGTTNVNLIYLVNLCLNNFLLKLSKKYKKHLIILIIVVIL